MLNYYGNSHDIYDHWGNPIEPEVDEAPEQPRCHCGAFLAWKHDHTRQPVEGVTQYMWSCRKCGAVNMLVEDVNPNAFVIDELPF